MLSFLYKKLDFYFSSFFVILSKIKNNFMPIVKVIEVIAASEVSIEDSIQQAVNESSKTIRNNRK